MNRLFLILANHGSLLIAAVVFGEAIGFPMPAAIALIAGGAAVASHSLNAPLTITLAVGSTLVGDTLLFVLGRYMGWSLLGFLCRLSINPESCILRSAESFYRRGKITLIFAKFIPGVNTMAPPLAGSMKMRLTQFLRFDAVGALLYILAYGIVGFLFRDFLAALTRGFQAASHLFGDVLFTVAVVYIGYRGWLYQKNKVYRVVPRVQAEELARKLVSEEKDKIVIMDVRSHGYYDADASRIRGSIRLEPNNLVEELKNLPRDKDIYVYCT